MHSTSRNLGYSLVLATILSIGALLVWTIGGAWAFTVLSQFFYASAPYDQLVFTNDGEPLVQTTEAGTNITVMRTIDGKPAERVEIQQFHGELRALRSGHQSVSTEPFQWMTHIMGFAEPSGLPVYWYAMLDTIESQHAYFVAYDAKTDERVGYLGLQGFRRDLPPLDDQFATPSETVGAYSGLFAGQTGYWAREPYAVASDPGAAVFLNGADALYRIDLAQREVTKVKIDGQIESIVTSEQPIRISADADLAKKRVVIATNKGMRELREPGNVVKKRRIIVRTPRRIDVLDDAGQILQSGALPAEVAERVLQACLTTEDKLLVVAAPDVRHDTTDIYWLAADAEPTRREQVRLGTTRTQANASWLLCLAMPSPIVDAVLFGYVMPKTLIASEQYDSYSAVLAEWLPKVLPALVALVSLSAMLAALAYRRQKQFGEPAAGAWSVFVLLLGPVGYIGYRLHRVWPVRSACRACGRATPVTLWNCSECAAEAPRPELRGIEILA
jgi:hypothetical protein